MAKLVKKGRRELYRAEREEQTPNDALTTREKVSYVVYDNGDILKCWVVWFRDKYERNGERHHNYGWKKYRKLKQGETAASFVEYLERQGFKVTRKL